MRCNTLVWHRLEVLVGIRPEHILTAGTIVGLFAIGAVGVVANSSPALEGWRFAAPCCRGGPFLHCEERMYQRRVGRREEFEVGIEQKWGEESETERERGGGIKTGKI